MNFCAFLPVNGCLRVLSTCIDRCTDVRRGVRTQNHRFARQNITFAHRCAPCASIILTCTQHAQPCITLAHPKIIDAHRCTKVHEAARMMILMILGCIFVCAPPRTPLFQSMHVKITSRAAPCIKNHQKCLKIQPVHRCTNST